MRVRDLLSKFAYSDYCSQIVIECSNKSYETYNVIKYDEMLDEPYYNNVLLKEVNEFFIGEDNTLYIYTKESKQITIVDVDFDNETHVINNEQELFDLYNDFMIVHYDLIDLGENVDKYDVDTMGKIRDEYSLIWKETVNGTYTLEDFEKRALEIIEGEK